jgi:LPS-assembly lipoprotein
MWLSNRRTFLALSGASLAVCTLQPANEMQSIDQILASITLETPRHQQPLYFRNALEDQLGSSETAPQYGLSYQLSTAAMHSPIAKDGRPLRQQVEGTVTFMLRDLTSNAVVYTQNRRAFAGYFTNGSPATTQAAARDAERRLMQQLADEVIRDLMFYGAA